MSIYTDVLQIVAPFAGLFFCWWAKTTWTEFKADLKELKESDTRIEKSVTNTQKECVAINSNITQLQSAIIEIKKIVERHSDALVIVKTDVVRIEEKVLDVKQMRADYGKIIQILDKVVKRS